jgi:hypothetical protein
MNCLIASILKEAPVDLSISDLRLMLRTRYGVEWDGDMSSIVLDYPQIREIKNQSYGWYE